MWNFAAFSLALVGAVAQGWGDLPTGWSDADIGFPSRAGGASYSGGTWTVSGGGADIWGNSDQFNFASEAVSGDGSIIARVTDLENTDSWGKAGVMFRNDSSASSMFAMAVITPGNGVGFQWRDTTGGACNNAQLSGNAPVWVKMTRVNSAFSAYYSTDGQTWVQIGGAQAIPMNSTVLAGLVVTAHNDNLLNTAHFDSVSSNNNPPPPPPPPPPAPVFGLYRQMWTGLSFPASTIYYVTNTSANPNWPDFPNTNYTKYFDTFETEINSGIEYYGQRTRAFLVPPTNGAYTFWVSSDDASQLFLSTDENPSNVVEIASVNSWTPSRQWAVEPNQQSVPIQLRAGRRYYFEGVMQQSAGGDNFAARWQFPNGTVEEPIPANGASGTRMIPFTGVSVAPGIYTQPTNITAIEGADAQFSLLVTNPAPVTYQWRLNGTKIANATQAVYVSPSVSSALSNAVFTCVVSNSSGVVTSSAAILTVIPDTVPPVIVRVVNIGTTNVQILFSKRLEQASATAAKNYVFSNGLTVTAATLGSTSNYVVLTTAPLVYGSNYTLIVNGVRDSATKPNVIATNTMVSFIASPFTPQDIGNPPIGSALIVLTNGLNLSGSGSDIGGNSDQFHFEYQPRVGDFDIAIRLAGLSPSDVWAKAGLMARETLDANSRFAAVLATPSMSGVFFETRDPVNTPANMIGRFPVNYPNTWLRIKRAANVFSGFASFDGQVWTPLGSVTISMPSQIYFGFAISSHNSSLATAAQFRDQQDVGANAVQGVVTLPHEALGPCDRKTCLVVSEIMYKPAPRMDSNNVEFLEIYNSNPYYQDISGYTVSGSKMSYTFPAGTIMPGGGFVVIAASPQSMQNVYGISAFGPYAGSLKKVDTIKIADDRGAILLTVPYSNVNPWPVAADGTGHSIVMANPTYGAASPQAWAISDAVGGSPGLPDTFHPTPLRNVVINEILAGQDGTFIELYNHSLQTNDLSGCILTAAGLTNGFIIPNGTMLKPGAFVSFNQTQLGFTLSRAGGTVFFYKPDQSRILDAVQYEAQGGGVSLGRSPDGANAFYPMSTPTPGAANGAIWIGDIAINELMYDPISGNDDDQYIELFNKGTNAVNLSNWQFTTGVVFTFPTNTVLAPNGYLVVTRNLTNIMAHYPYLTTANTIGNFAGKLSHKGARVALGRPQTLVETGALGLVTNTICVVQDEVTYDVGGRWGQWAKGGGSSLELRSPNSNHRLAYNWGDSDESSKSSWTNLEFTGILDNGANYNGGAIDYVQIGMLDVGEVLVDNLEIRPNGPTGANIVANGDFEQGLGSWYPQGDHMRSGVEADLKNGGQCLHLRASDSVWTLADYVQGPLTDTSMYGGQTVTLRMKVRWLYGSPEVLMRVRGNWIELTGAAPIPVNLGTPGLPNSRFVTNAGPAIYEVSHSPALPAANQALVVTARFNDLTPVRPTMLYRIDSGVNPTPTYTSVTMTDNGKNGDAIANDGVYSATIPGQSAGTVVAFIVQATNSQGVTTVFPSDIKENAGLPRECVVGFGDVTPTGNGFSHHHMFITQNWAQRWANWGGVSHETHDATWIDGGGRIVYNIRARYAGSPYHQYTGSPVTTVGGMHWVMPDDDKVLGTTSFNKQHVPGNGPLDDDTLQREQTSYWMARQIGLPWANRRYYIFFVNGIQHAPVMEDAQTPNGDMVTEYFPNDDNGFLYKNHSWFEGDVVPSPGGYMNFNMPSWCMVDEYTTTINGVPNQKKLERYRWMWWIRQYPDSANNFTNVYNLVDALNTPTSSSTYYSNIEALVDTEEWLRMSAMEHASGDWDSFFTQNQWNMYNYKPTNGKWTALKWDWNISLGSGTATWGPDAGNLLNFNPNDGVMATFQSYAPYLRTYLRGLKDIASLGMNVDLVSPVLDSKYSAFQAAGVTAVAPTALKTWIGTAHNSILSVLDAQGVTSVPFAITGTVTNGNLLTFSGTAPLEAKTIWVNGEAFPITWTGVKNWSMVLPVAKGTNHLVFQGYDLKGNSLTNLTATVDSAYASTIPSPVGAIVINEIMYNPAVSGSQFVELYNTSSSSFDISGWQMQGLSYTFPSGSFIGPKAYLVLAANRAAFISAYGTTTPVFDTFNGTLQLDGETLTLVQPGTTATNDVEVAKVRYETGLPWPLGAYGTGRSVQLIDATRDNWRAGNWAVNTNSGLGASPAAANTVAASLTAFQTLWINEVQASNTAGITNSAGQHTPWLEIYNPGSNSVTLTGLYLANSYTNLTNWVFPAGALIKPGEFKVVFADGQTNLSTTNELHTSFTLAATNGSIALSRLNSGRPQVLDYINYTNLAVNHSYGSLPDGQSFRRQDFTVNTPGAINVGLVLPPPSSIAYVHAGDVYSQSFDSLPSPGAASVNTANPVTINGVTYSLANPFDFAAPVLPSGGIGGLGLAGMAGWYGMADPTSSAGTRFGATSGDQTTGGEISFGLPGSNNRALGLLATSSTGFTAFGAKFINQTPDTLTHISVSFTAELWRQSTVAKTLICSYYIDPTAAASLTTAATGYLPALNVSFPTAAGTSGGVPVDGTAPSNQAQLAIVNQVITNWPPNAALWLVWEMADPAGKAQGLGMDAFSFSASTGTVVIVPPSMTVQTSANGQLVVSWPTVSGPSYQVEYKTNLNDTVWMPVGTPVIGNGGAIKSTNSVNAFSQCYLRLKITQ